MGSTGLGIERSAAPDQATIDDDPRSEGADLVAALLPAQAPPPNVRAMPERPRWEYRTELLERGFMGFGSGQVDLLALDQRLDELGAEGWELVHATWDQSVRGKRGGHLLLFKRPRVETSPFPETHD